MIDALQDLEILEDTLVYYIVGDNGASAEGTPKGTFNELFIFNGAAHLETPEFLASKIDDFGGPTAFNHYAVGWAHATTRRINGRSRSPRTSAAPATARSFTGPPASARGARSAPSSTTSSTSRRRSWR